MIKDTPYSMSKRARDKIMASGWNAKYKVRVQTTGEKYHPIFKTRKTPPNATLFRVRTIQQDEFTLKQILSRKWYESYVEYLMKTFPKFKDDTKHGMILIQGVPVLGVIRRYRDVVALSEPIIDVINDIMVRNESRNFEALRKIRIFKAEKRLRVLMTEYNSKIRYHHYSSECIEVKRVRKIRALEDQLGKEHRELPTTY